MTTKEIVKHTPGPWEAKAGPGRWNVTTTGKPRTFNICSINTDRIEQEANALLIAAAPELLEACKLLMQYMEDPDGPSSVAEEGMHLAKIAIAKAEGGK